MTKNTPLLFSVDKTFSIPKERVIEKFIDPYRGNFQFSFIAENVNDTVEYHEVKYVDKFAIDNDYRLTFVETVFSKSMETRYFFEYLLSNYGTTWVILDNTLLHTHLHSVREEIYKQKVKRYKNNVNKTK